MVVVVTVLCCICARRKEKMDISPQSRMYHICMCLRTTVLVCVQAYLQVVVIEELLASLCRDSAEMSIEYVPVFVGAELLGSSVY